MQVHLLRTAAREGSAIGVGLSVRVCQAMQYAMSVIVGRALPDVQDGLKPVHRRILYAMNDLGLVPTKPYRHAAAILCIKLC